MIAPKPKPEPIKPRAPRKKPVPKAQPQLKPEPVEVRKVMAIESVDKTARRLAFGVLVLSCVLLLSQVFLTQAQTRYANTQDAKTRASVAREHEACVAVAKSTNDRLALYATFFEANIQSLIHNPTVPPAQRQKQIDADLALIAAAKITLTCEVHGQ